MARFMVIHKLNTGSDRDFQDMRAARKKLFGLAENSDVQWLNSWWAFAAAQSYCEYEAKDADTIRRALSDSGLQEIMPAVTIEEVMLSGPEDFPGEFAEE